MAMSPFWRNVSVIYWDLLPESIQTDFATTCGTDPSFMPCLSPYVGVTFSFIYHEDIMEQAGLNPPRDRALHGRPGQVPGRPEGVR